MDVDWSVREADYALDHLHDWLKQDHVHTPLLMEPGQPWRVRRDPLGVTLIIGAWNEPDMLTIGPLVAIAAGNTAAVKPSEICEACAAQLAEMVPECLDSEAVAVAEGGIPETTARRQRQLAAAMYGLRTFPAGLGLILQFDHDHS